MKSEACETVWQPTDEALILVDLQNDFLPGGALAVSDGDAVIPLANRLQTRFQLVVATRDWHPQNHGSFAANHPDRSPGEIIRLDGLRQVLWPVHCVQGTRGAELADGLQPCAGRHEFFKGQDPNLDSYSGFFDNDHRRSTGLDEFLRRRGVKRVYIMGLATDYCVRATAHDAVQLGYQVTLVVDGCRGVDIDPGDSQRAIESLADEGVQLLDSEAILRQEQTGSLRRGRRACDADCAAPVLVAETPHLALVRRGDWDYVRRIGATGVVAIIAVTAEDELLLVEQYRPPVNGRVIELPAGLVGDIAGAAEESLEDAARRELLEETGYRANSIRCIFTGASSAGLTDEMTSFLLANDVERIAAGGGDDHEDILVHRVPLTSIDAWLGRQISAGIRVDARVPSGLYLFARERHA